MICRIFIGRSLGGDICRDCGEPKAAHKQTVGPLTNNRIHKAVDTLQAIQQTVADRMRADGIDPSKFPQRLMDNVHHTVLLYCKDQS